MPKVETSLNPRGQLSYIHSESKNNVSNTTGKEIVSIRSKRDLNNTDNATTPLPVQRKRKRVVKKLVRVHLHNNNDMSHTTESTEDNVTTVRSRRRLLIRKKKRRLLNHVNNQELESGEDLQQVIKPRRKIIVTRKRLLPTSSKTQDFNLVLSNETVAATPTLTAAPTTSYQLHLVDSKSDDVTEENLIEVRTEDDSNEDVTPENFTVHEDNSKVVKDNITANDTNYGADAVYESTEEINVLEGDSDEDVTTQNFPDDEDNIKVLKDNITTSNDTSYGASGLYTEEINVLEDNFKNDLQVERAQRNERINKFERGETELFADTTDVNLTEDSNESITEPNSQPIVQDVPEYEPFFPELSESVDDPVLLLKTTVLSSIELLTKTIVQSRLRTYTFVVTRVHGDEQIITSTTEVKPQTKTSILTEPHTIFTTLTLLDIDTTQTMTEPQKTIIPTLDNPQPQLLNQDNAGRNHEEARYNLATRVMSNGVEVIVAGDKSTLPGEPDVKRVLPSSSQKPVTLKPSTLTDHMVMMLPQTSTNIEGLTSSLYPNQFVTKTCLTTFTYLTTFLEGSTTTVSSHEQIVSNIATEERNTGKILPTPAIGITLTQYPNLSVGVFHTTYTYLNTILDGEQPLVVSSKHTVTNTVTAPDDYLSLLKPSETLSAIKDTNTYYSTLTLEKTLYEGNKSSVVRTNEVITQVVITESVPPRVTSVMTSYIALDMENPTPSSLPSYSTTDVVKTYFVTYTYYNTVMENGKPVVNTNVSTSTDVVTEKLYLYPKKTANNIISTSPIAKNDKKKHKIDLSDENFHILATKTYFTTFTYYTTLLQEDNSKTPTIISSRTSVVQNVVTETVDPSLLDKEYMDLLKSDIKDGSSSITKMATLQDGQKLELTVIADEIKGKVKPTKVLPIEKTKIPETAITTDTLINESSSSPSVITGSTIIFVDDDPFAQLAPTPTLSSATKTSITSVKVNLGSLLSSEIVKETTISTAIHKSKRSTKTKVKTQTNVVSATRTKSPSQQHTSSVKPKPQNNPSLHKGKPSSDKKKQTTATKITKPALPASELLGLGSINIDSLQALTPVLNAMAGLITTNLKSNRRSDTNITTTTTTPRTKLYPKLDHVVPAVDIQNRSPIYIPVRGLDDDFEIAESQNIATFDWIDPPKDYVPGKTAHEAPLLNGGIPISPGDVITANSDVIVGRPGRIGPRIPSIPLNQVKVENEVPIGMKPPPFPNEIWPNKNQEYGDIPVAHVRNEAVSPNIIHAPNKDDYVGPPPPIQSPKENLRGDKRKHIALPPLHEERPYYESEFYNHDTRYGNNEIPPNRYVYSINEINHDSNLPSLQNSIQKNYDSVAENSYPIYAQDHASVLPPGIPINNFNIEPSVINQPIVLPEIVERSTGQPLLVNIQPSQVAFVNIPFNRTTALIYGGSTEPHRNGQYFDDPSPYPVPEFSGIEFNNGVPHVASVYHDGSLNQKQVNGVIKVENQLIKVEPTNGDDQKNQLIKPTKPHNDAQIAFGSNHEVSINVPPISFGLINQGNDFNAHVINHGDIEFRPPATPYQVTNQQDDVGRPNYQEILQNFNRGGDIKRPVNNVSPNLPNNNNDGGFVDQYLHYPDIHERPISNEQKPRPISNEKRPTYQYKIQNGAQTNDILNDLPKRRPEPVDGSKPYQNKPNYPSPPKRNILLPRPLRPDRPNMEISEYMTPPPFNGNPLVKRPYLRRTTSKKPPLIPIVSVQQLVPHGGFNSPYNPHLAQVNAIPSHHLQKVPGDKNNITYNSYNVHEENFPTYSNSELDIGDHRDDDLANEEGEVIQESNSRPLLPGEVPFEILKARTSTTTERTTRKSDVVFPNEENIKFPNYSNEVVRREPPFVSQNAKPFARPENTFVRPQIPLFRPNSSVSQNHDINEVSKGHTVNINQFNKPTGFHRQSPTTEASSINTVGSHYNEGVDSDAQHATHEHKNNPTGFVVVGSQFEDPGNQPFVISGNQFTDIVGHVNNNHGKITTNKIKNQNTSINKPKIEVATAESNKQPVSLPKVTTKKYQVITESTTSNSHALTTNSKSSVGGYKLEPTTSTTQKPIIIYIDEKVENKENFFHNNGNRNKVKPNNDRPSVTSLPIDTLAAKTAEISHGNSSHAINTQTEKPFIPQRNPSQPSNEVIIQDAITTEQPIFTTKQTMSSGSTTTSKLNIGEVTTELSDMEIMKPPPLVADVPIKQYTEIQPPKIGTDISRVPIQSDSQPQSSSPKPYVPRPLEEMVPPPETTTDEEILGMSPPPLISTHKPITNDKSITTTKPVFSLQIDIPKEVPAVFKPSTTTTTTEGYNNRDTKTRRPHTRRPGYRRTTTPTSTTADITIYTKKSSHPVYVTDKNDTSTVSYVDSKKTPTTERVISPSPTVKVPPSLEVIIGHPNLNVKDAEPPTTTIVNKEPNTENNKIDIALSGSELPIQESTTETTIVLDKQPSVLLPGIQTVSYDTQPSKASSSKKDIITQAVHHAGNEIKIIDETIGSVEVSTKKVVPTITKENKHVIPTRYITHTKTSTVTITKTTVVKTLGGPPSTLTILVTKTEKSTIVETVTEFHTLVKPTSIIETVTTTIQRGSSLYPPDVYGSTYPSIQVRPSLVAPFTETSTISSTPTSDKSFEDLSEEDLEDFIISETDPPISDEKDEDMNNNDSILVIMTDKNTKGIIKVPNSSHETQDRDEVLTSNDANNVLLAGILSASHPSTDDSEAKATDKCEPECKASRNELCQRVEGIMRCACRPGFARMFPDRPCLPTYTYDLNITLDRIGKEKLHYYDDLANKNSTDFYKFAQATQEALDRMVMQSDLRDIFHGVQVHSFQPSLDNKDIVNRFYLQLSDNIDENRLEDILKKYLRSNNYSLGGTDIFASPKSLDELRAQDFDECSYSKFHDCSENAQCFNLKGTYTCSCKEGFSDLSENMLYPGRICSAEQVGCERCSYHGTCYSREGDEMICECFHWYAGESCHINLKVLLIALVTLGTILLILLLVCTILTCVRRKPRNAGMAAGMSFFPQRVGSSGNRGTLDRRAMIQDTSSEDSRSETNTLPYVQVNNNKQKKPKGALKKTSKVSMQHSGDVENRENTLSFSDQKDRSLTVMIPRAKYHPAPPTSPLINYTTFDARKPSVPSVSEAKLLSYLDAGPSPNKSDNKRKFSNAPSDSFVEEKQCSRKTSGALVSAGFEVSATVVNNMGTLGTTCGTEADRSENATLIQKISADLLSSTGTRSQFNTLRKSLVDDDIESSSNWLDIVPRVATVSEARSYDETTIPPPVKSFRNDFDSKPSSQHPNDEANTMAERDLGSTFLLPHTHLYKPDRGSDISGFESL